MDHELLRKISILRALTAEELDAFAALLTLRDVPTRTRILEEGTVVRAFHIVCDGVVHVRRMTNKRELLLSRMGAGAFFGEINLFDPGVATASIYAMKPTKLAAIEYETFRQFMESHPATGYKIVSAMMTETARRLRQTSARLVNSVYWSGGEPAPAPAA